MIAAHREKLIKLPYLINQPPETEFLNDLNWHSGLSFECFGVKVGIRFNKHLSFDEIRQILPRHWRELDNGAVDNLFSVRFPDGKNLHTSLYFNDYLKFNIGSDKLLFETLKIQLNLIVSRQSPERVFIHAGVVAVNGKLILIPGNGFSGKTTLTAEFVKAGAVYYSDDSAVLDQSGLVYPFPKPIAMRQKKSVNGAQTHYDVSHYGGIQGEQPLPVSLVLITKYRAYGRWNPRALTVGQGILEMLKHTNNSLKQPELAVRVLQKVATQAKIVKSERGEAHKVVKAILNEA